MIRKMEKLARKVVIIGTPNESFPFDPLEGKDGNKLQEHHSGYTATDFKAFGYKVYEQGGVSYL